MSIARVTQRMTTATTLDALQAGLGRMAKVQEQLATGRVLNRPSDNPTDVTSAMRLRSSISDTQQYARNASDGLGWLNMQDQTLSSATLQVRRARDLALQGANQGTMGPAARETIAAEVDQLRDNLISTANATYLDRPVFGGITSGDRAYNADGTFAGTPGEVSRRVADGVLVRVDTLGTDVFGPDGDSLFDDLDKLSVALRAGDTAAVRTGLAALNGRLDDITSAQAGVGARTNRVELANQAATDGDLVLTTNLSTLENADLPKTIVDLQLAQVAYQASLGAASRVLQPSLLDFLR